MQLLDRHTRQVRLSEAGREFLPSVHRLLAELQTAVAGVTDLRDKKKGVLRLAAPQLMACTLLPQVIAAFRARYPDVQVRLADTLPEQLLAGVMAGDAELAVGQDVAVDPKIERRTLFCDRHWLICPPDHPFAQRSSVRWHELGPWTFIGPTRDFRSRIAPELAPDARGASAYRHTGGVLHDHGLGNRRDRDPGSAVVRAYSVQPAPHACRERLPADAVAVMERGQRARIQKCVRQTRELESSWLHAPLQQRARYSFA